MSDVHQGHGHEHHQRVVLAGHESHESLHVWLALFVIVAMVASQYALNYWRAKHEASYVRVSLLLVWLLPAILSLREPFVRFLVIWSLWTLSTGYIIYLATRRPLHHSTPKCVYRWFLLCYKLSYTLAVIGFVMLVIGMAAQPVLWLIETGILVLFYGLYLGVLSRDCAEVCADRMASSMGYSSKAGDGVAPMSAAANTCLICGQVLDRSFEPAFTLSCSHEFHESCVRGWVIVGKKDCCPYCSERVDLAAFKTNRWNLPSVVWAQLLQMVRMLAAWNPLILVVIQLIVWAIDRPSL